MLEQLFVAVLAMLEQLLVVPLEQLLVGVVAALEQVVVL